MKDGKTRKILQILKDDTGKPDQALAGAREAVQQDKVFAMFATLSTAQNVAIMPYLNQQKVPQLFAASGAPNWGVDPKANPWTIGFQPDYTSSSYVFADYIKATVPNAKVAILYQNDDFGKAWRDGLKTRLGAQASIVGEQSYELTDPTLDTQMTKLANSGANVFANFSIGRATAQSIQKAAALGWKPLQLVDDGGANTVPSLAPELREGIISSRFLKDAAPAEFSSDPAIKEYLTVMQKYYGAGFSPRVSVQGAAMAQVLVQVLQQMSGPTRNDLMNTVRHLKNVRSGLLLDGISLNTTPTQGFPIRQVQLVKYQGDGWTAIGPARGA
jgi:branched-chain amino acid transport system substrate-binding protein